VIGAKNVVINVDTNSLSMKESNYNAVFQNAQTKMYWDLIKGMVVKVSVNTLRQEFSRKEQENIQSDQRDCGRSSGSERGVGLI
jgi:hypothetical protein